MYMYMILLIFIYFRIIYGFVPQFYKFPPNLNKIIMNNKPLSYEEYLSERNNNKFNNHNVQTGNIFNEVSSNKDIGDTFKEVSDYDKWCKKRPTYGQFLEYKKGLDNFEKISPYEKWRKTRPTYREYLDSKK